MSCRYGYGRRLQETQERMPGRVRERVWKRNCWKAGILERIEKEIGEIRAVLESIHQTLKAEQ